jgi:hypothetical protein
MNIRVLFLAAALVATSASAQQTLRPVQLPTSPATTPAPATSPATTTAPVQAPTADPNRVQAVRPDSLQQGNVAADQINRAGLLEAEVKRLREANKKLKADVASLTEQLNNYRVKGGSLVHAYCPTRTLSRTTAGDEQDCATSGYTCEGVSGQCRTTCQIGDHCATGYTCDTGKRQCIYTAGGVPVSDD